ncbi:adenylosuccinate lyase [Constantimarinum furrinae]|uniref:Adenylosuccinate lyase n=1 Tax=Constantimarinum furrinae TaxID=2562285 RepID=A0A7G8PW19_9FLAO|nr:adenylosuccinate lyase [Constantimarinum furrinae]QNJ98535.1 hypothetical protein ALE3EI_1988 [Constantimarinum furrinae]
MSSELLIQKLNYTKAYRKTRLEVAQWVLDHPETFEELLRVCFSSEKELSYKATWILEFVCAERLSLLYPHFELFFTNIPNVKRDQALRPIAKVCDMIAVKYYKDNDPEIKDKFSVEHRKLMTECCFDWLITDQKVACKVFAMHALFYLGTEYDWIHPELNVIISENIHHNSPAYKARGKYVLGKIQKFNRQ